MSYIECTEDKFGDYKVKDVYGNKLGKVSGQVFTSSNNRMCMTTHELRAIADFIDVEMKIRND